MLKKPDYWDMAKEHLSEKDQVLAKILAENSPAEFLSRSNNSFEALLNSIIGQQLSVKAAATIKRRFFALFKKITPEAVCEGDLENYRTQGLSYRKADYVRNLAEFFIKENLKEEDWKTWSDEEIRKNLLTVKGVGKWTVDMFLIFYMNRPDIFPLGDLGVLKAVNQLYFKGKEQSQEKYLRLSNRWKPYRTVATWYLWRYLDNEPVQY